MSSEAVAKALVTSVTMCESSASALTSLIGSLDGAAKVSAMTSPANANTIIENFIA
jgi:hypothetical protein